MRVDRHVLFAAAVVAGALGCSGSTEPPGPAGPLPAFIYVADSNGSTNLYRFRNDSAVQLTTGENNYDPNSAAKRLVFTSTRDGNQQIYISDLNVDTAHRVMNSGAFDYSPALSPGADSIVFVSTRSGTDRLWVIAAPALDAAGFGTPAALATGSQAFYPESAPAWNPKGGSIVFSSTASGTSQIYVVPSGGGTEVQVTSELNGAFQPTWSADGTQIYYIAPTPSATLKRVSSQGGQAVTVIPDSLTASGPASCNVSYCIFAPSPTASNASMNSLNVSAHTIGVLFPETAALERQPAILVP
jgi:dipeptidyl aminopeptidase/acylaminoacyl peptidase